MQALHPFHAYPTRTTNDQPITQLNIESNSVGHFEKFIEYLLKVQGCLSTFLESQKGILAMFSKERHFASLFEKSALKMDQTNLCTSSVLKAIQKFCQLFFYLSRRIGFYFLEYFS